MNEPTSSSRNSTPKCIAIILAGGVGSRMKLDYPKQFFEIAGKTILEHTISVFQNHNQIDEIVIVSEKDSLDRIKVIVDNANFDKVKHIVLGGRERSDSTLAAILALENYSNNDKILIHDAVRPLVNFQIITQCIQKLESYDAVATAIAVNDTIVQIDKDRLEIKSIPERSMLWKEQTPQAFRLGTLKKSYEIYQNSDIHGTCDCSIVFKTQPEIRIGIVEGLPENIKITQPVDLTLIAQCLDKK